MTLSCIISYIHVVENLIPGADMTASASWETAAGTPVSSSSTPIGVNKGEKLQVDVEQVPSGTEIPSYTCTASFDFTDTDSVNFDYAVNDLTWECVSQPVLTWCKYIAYNVRLHALLLRAFTGAGYYDQSVCLSVTLSVFICQSIRTDISIKRGRTLPNFCARYPWPWLRPPLATLRYVMYFRFGDDVTLSHNGLYSGDAPAA